MATGQENVIITVFSTSSGNGKTITAINTAAALAKEGYSTCLVDFNLQFGDVLNYLQLPQSELTLYDAQTDLVQHPENFSIRKYLTSYQYKNIGFSILPPPHLLDEAYQIDVTEMEKLIAHLQYFDFIVIDLTASFSALNLAMLDMSTIINYLGVVNFLPDIKNYKVGYDTLLHFQYDENKIRLIENRSGSASPFRSKDVTRFLGASFNHQLPNDYPAVIKSIQDGIPLVLNSPDSVLARSFWNLTGYYTGRPNHAHVSIRQPVERKGFLSRIAGFFKN